MSEFDNRHSENQGSYQISGHNPILGDYWCQSQRVSCVMMNTCLMHLLQVHIERT